MNFNFMGIRKPKPTKNEPANLFKKKLILNQILRVLKETDWGEETPQQKAKFAKMEIHLMSDQQVENIYQQLKLLYIKK